MPFSQVFPKPELILYSGDPLHAVLFRNQKDLSAVGSPSFTPDGKQIVFAQSVNGRGMQIFIANTDGANQRNLTGIDTTDVEPKVNPKTGQQMVFVSGRAGHQQIYSMNIWTAPTWSASPTALAKPPTRRGIPTDNSSRLPGPGDTRRARGISS
jgi:dipeptidyl aminopeptidase/acylaminoacyl peptidase